jgi:hypothetical protein
MMIVRAALAIVLLAVVFVRPAPGQAPIYPGTTWARVPSVGQIGWSEEKLGEARAYAGTINTAAVMIVVGGLVVDEWGDTTHALQRSLHPEELPQRPVRQARAGWADPALEDAGRPRHRRSELSRRSRRARRWAIS